MTCIYCTNPYYHTITEVTYMYVCFHSNAYQSKVSFSEQLSVTNSIILLTILYIQPIILLIVIQVTIQGGMISVYLCRYCVRCNKQQLLGKSCLGII